MWLIGKMRLDAGGCGWLDVAECESVIKNESRGGFWFVCVRAVCWWK